MGGPWFAWEGKIDKAGTGAYGSVTNSLVVDVKGLETQESSLQGVREEHQWGIVALCRLVVGWTMGRIRV